MADQSDVETGLVTLISEALYPNGPRASSACGQPCRIYRGWPSPAALNADLAAGLVHATVTAMDGTARNTTRYADSWLPDPPACALSASTAGRVVTFAGTVSPGQLAGLAVDGKTYVYRTQADDTPALVAAYLAAQVRSDQIAQLSGTAISFPLATTINARTGSDATSRLEVRRQNQRFRIAAWCNDPVIRDVAVATIDVSLAAFRFIPLGDGSQARLLFAGGVTLDRSENASLYRRDLFYDVEYATTIAAMQPTMLFGTGTVNSASIIG